MEDLRDQPRDVVEEADSLLSEIEEIEEIDEVDAPTDKPVSVILPDDVVDAYTEKYKDLRALKFSYRPMSSREEAKYLDTMSRTTGAKTRTVKLGRGRSKQVVERAEFSVQKLAEINWKLLADHVVDGEIYDRNGDKIDFANADEWKNVDPRVIFDIVGTIAGLTQSAVTAETEQQTGL